MLLARGEMRGVGITGETLAEMSDNLHEKKRALFCGNARSGCFRPRWMASSSAEASSYAQGFGVTRTARPAFAILRLGRQPGGRKSEVPPSPRLRLGKQWSDVRCKRRAEHGVRVAIMPEVETRFSVAADQAAEAAGFKICMRS